MENNISDMKQMIFTQQASINTIRDPPVFFQCAYTLHFTKDSSPIQYEKMFYSRTNQWTETGGINLSSGLWTSPYDGTYTITYSLQNGHSYGGRDIILHLRKNGQEIPETHHFSEFQEGSVKTNWLITEQGGRTIVSHFNTG